MSTTDAADGNRLAYHPPLDGIRALAVAAVVVFHLHESGLTGGFLGVDAFFVLSGFLITTLLVLEWRRTEGIGLVAFWGRRARRLLPALLLLLVAVAVYASFEVPSTELGRLRWDGISGLFYVANWRFVASGQSYFDLFTGASPFRHLWSLAIEEQFYLVWPLVTLGCLTLAKGRLRVLGAVTLAGVVVSTALMALLYDTADPSRVLRHGFPRAPDPRRGAARARARRPSDGLGRDRPPRSTASGSSRSEGSWPRSPRRTTPRRRCTRGGPSRSPSRSPC